MKLGIMQPYFLPYIGYWQLLNAVDTYVIYDDVTFIKSGWIHRNRINVHGTAQFINVQMQGASSFSRICDIRVNPDLRWREKLLQTIAMAYRKAPHYTEIIPLAENIIMCGEEKLGDFLAHSLHIVAQYLQIDTQHGVFVFQKVGREQAGRPTPQDRQPGWRRPVEYRQRQARRMQVSAQESRRAAVSRRFHPVFAPLYIA